MTKSTHRNGNFINKVRGRKLGLKKNKSRSIKRNEQMRKKIQNLNSKS